MDYSRHYTILVERARSRNIDGYVEQHHIIPRCMGGTDDCSNIVSLTAREHFLAHQLLVKMYPREGGLIAAVRFLTANNKVRNNRMYEWLRKRHSEAMSIFNKGKKMTPEQIAKAAASHVGKKRSEAAKKKMSIAAKKRKLSESGRTRISEARKRFNEERRLAGIPHHNMGRIASETQKASAIKTFKGKKQTPEQIAKRVASRKKTLLNKKLENIRSDV